ncbi:hypothetical protein THAOC_05664 [Thalassiosira oceanica]|uniref:Uncharacterized protein n=1 Tax=Thalassiosira oceanica TaxID=159749 RepID=K0T6U2_THAOC|nr:hypothetical protein THAOC_05664 [Thalassiosira oceanica]|eukprot:EJK72769.1 hypothetical protein THAOC_05664 [Thalassiosira oceanica]
MCEPADVSCGEVASSLRRGQSWRSHTATGCLVSGGDRRRLAPRAASHHAAGAAGSGRNAIPPGHIALLATPISSSSGSLLRYLITFIHVHVYVALGVTASDAP